MTLTAPTVPDTTSVIQAGVVSAQSNAQLLASGTLLTKTATKSFSIHYNGAVITFPAGKPVVVTPTLIAFLTAGGYPVV